MLDVSASGGLGQTTAAVAFEDAPFSVFDQIGLRDPGADIVSSMSGINLHFLNLLQANYRDRLVSNASNVSEMGEPLTGSSLFQAVDANGNFRFIEHLPIGLNLKTLTALLGNQDRAYILTVNLSIASPGASTSGPIYTTAPAGNSAFPSLTITPNYRSFTVPDATSGGVAQQRRPDNYGVVHLGTAASNASAPSNGGQIAHYLVNLGPTFRSICWVFRSVLTSGAATRANAELAAPTSLQMFWGSTGANVETWAIRRALMFERFGVNFPAGSLCYDYISDGGPGAGVETGSSYINTQNLVNSRLLVSYPTTSGQWAAGSTLFQVVDSLDYTAPAGG
ncbi:MAG: hypothetical protein ACRDUW_06525 [Pseudonocardiaceae bacterium]